MDTEDRGRIFLPLPGMEPRSPGRPVRSQVKVHTLLGLTEGANPNLRTH
jgi:hypothetical protein